MTLLVRGPIPPEADAALALYPELIRQLLFYRGIADAKTAEAFLNPDYDAHTHDPFLMKGMEKAVEKILSLIRANKRIAIFSDYDADGIPGGIIVHDFFKKIGFTNFTNYIPHRHDEGFGLNTDALEMLSLENVKLIITVDCGIADAKEMAHAKSLGIETIVTDHHLPPASGAPEAFAVLDPKQDGCAYPDKNLCGSGVAYKLVQGLIQKGKFDIPKGWEKWLLDLVGLATLSDMVPLVGENRVFASFGLRVLRKSPRVGLQRLLRRAGVEQRLLTEDDIVFSVTPKLNAASRMGSADVAFRLLTASNETEADAAVAELLELNDKRRGIVASLVRDVHKTLEARSLERPTVIVAGNPNWRPSLLGLVANSLMKEFGCPVFLWGRDGSDALKGSCRSDSVNLVELMQEARDALLEFGGHAFSGGFTVSLEKVSTLDEALAAALGRLDTSGSERAHTAELADSVITADEVTRATYALIERLAPFGEGNPKPLFRLDDVLVRASKSFGKEKNHLEVALERHDGSVVKAIRFFSDDIAAPATGSKVRLLASLENSNYRGRSELRLRIVDIV